MTIPSEKNETFVMERLNRNEYHTHKVRRVLCQRKSSRQLIEIVELENYGKSLVLDGQIQSTEKDEHIYHESLIYPAYCFADSIERVLCIGGANGGVLREIVKFPDIQRIDIVDLDEDAVRLSRDYLPHMHERSFDHPSVNLTYAEPREWLRHGSDSGYDIVYADLQDIESSSLTHGLFNIGFYLDIAKKLKQNGLFVTHAGYFNSISGDAGNSTIERLRNVFSYVKPYAVYIPSLGCLWMFVIASCGVNTVSYQGIGKRLSTLKGEQPRFFNSHHYRVMRQMATLRLSSNQV
jgi:spermidine synthase